MNDTQQKQRSPIRWTNTAPAEPGFYYWQGRAMQGDQVAVIQIRKTASGSVMAMEMIGVHRYAPTQRNPSDWGGSWAGPLPEPW